GVDGKVTVVGKTSSTDFPVSNAIYGSKAGGADAFVTRFKPIANSGWVYSTYAGGTLDDQANGVALDLLGSAYITGTTQSTNFPTKGPYRSSNAGASDAFVLKIVDAAAGPAFTSISTDTGSSSTDRITTDQTLIFSGTAPAGSTVTITRRNVGDIGTVASSGTWTFNYTSTTLPEGTYAFVATANVMGKLSAPTSEFLVTVDRTAPTVSVAVPASTPSKAPQIQVTAQDWSGLPNGTQV